MRIIIIEDSPQLAVSLRTLLEEQGHQVTWIVGVSSIDHKQLQCYPGIMSYHFPRCCVDQVQLANFELAFVDGHLDGALDGWDLMPHLRGAGIQCIAISNTQGVNDKMVAAGAIRSMLKGDVLDFVSKTALPEQLVGITA